MGRLVTVRRGEFVLRLVNNRCHRRDLKLYALPVPRLPLFLI